MEVLRRAVLPQAAVGVSPADSGGQGLPLFEALPSGSVLLQAGHDHVCQVLLEPLEVLPETNTDGSLWIMILIRNVSECLA